MSAICNEKETILVVDDDVEIRDLLVKILNDQGNGYNVLSSETIVDAEKTIQENRIDLMLLDYMLPNEDGISFCRRITDNRHLPVMMITAVADDMDAVLALEGGALDYIKKPFNPRILVSKIKAFFRMQGDRNASVNLTPSISKPKYQFETWTLDTATHFLQNSKGNNISLSETEYRLLHMLVTHPQRELSRKQLVEAVHQRHFDPFDRSIDLAIHRLRRKLSLDANASTFIKTIYAGGYLFIPHVRQVI